MLGENLLRSSGTGILKLYWADAYFFCFAALNEKRAATEGSWIMNHRPCVNRLGRTVQNRSGETPEPY